MHDRDAAVAYARQELEAIFDTLAEFKEILPTGEEYVIELDKLSKLRAKEPPLSLADQLDLTTYEFRRAYRLGLAPKGFKPKLSPYVARVEKLIEASEKSSIAFCVLGAHAARLISDNHGMIPQLRIFVVEVLRGTRKEPSTTGSPKLISQRDELFYGLLVDVADRFGVHPTRNRLATSGMSACDIVAEAMPRKARLPKSYGALERIWIKGKKRQKMRT